MVKRTPKPVPPATTTTAPPAETGTIVEAPVTATDTAATSIATATTTATAANNTTTTQAPAPAPMTITPTPAATATTASTGTEPMPVVRPRSTPATTKPAASTASTATGRARYDEMARQFAANQPKFSVQIQILCDPANLEKAMRDGGGNVWFVPQSLGTRSCYRVYWGRFETREEAQRALANVPASLRDRSSAVKSLAR